MRYVPHKYQEHAANYILTHEKAAVFLECGLGKTVITLTALLSLCLDQFVIRKVLIIAPLRVARDTWPAEIEKWDHLKCLTYSVAVGSEKERMVALMKTADLYIINRENLDWLVNKSGASLDFDMVVIDELSSFKSGTTRRFKSLLKLRPYLKRIVGLTGTPASNNLLDLWAEYRVLDLGERLGRYITNYRNTYFQPDKRSRDVIFSYKPLPGVEEKIYERISDMTISMKSCDYLKLPECIYNTVTVHMDQDETKVYEEFRKEMVTSIEGKEIDAANAAVLTGKLLQMANGAIYDDDGNYVRIHDRKLDALEDLIEAANGKSILVAYAFKHDLERIKERFEVREIKTSQDIQDWNAGKIPVGLVHPASAGHGLNLQSGGSTLVWFGLTWSLELYMQTCKRLDRQGQKNTVVIHHIVTAGTMDERVLTALQKKDVVQTALIDAVKAVLS